MNSYFWMDVYKNFLNRKITTAFSILLVAIAIVETGLSASEIFAQTNNQSQGQQSDEGIGSIEELENLTASPSNDTSNTISLTEGLEKSQSGDVVAGEQDVRFEGQQGNQTQSQGQQGNQTEDKGILEKLGEAVGLN